MQGMYKCFSILWCAYIFFNFGLIRSPNIHTLEWCTRLARTPNSCDIDIFFNYVKCLQIHKQAWNVKPLMLNIRLAFLALLAVLALLCIFERLTCFLRSSFVRHLIIRLWSMYMAKFVNYYYLCLRFVRIDFIWLECQNGAQTNL